VFATHEEVVAHALATAREIASKSPLAVAGSKVMINYARDHTIKDAWTTSPPGRPACSRRRTWPMEKPSRPRKM
jgi:hypothetical protein